MPEIVQPIVANGSVPIPIGPQKKAAILITIILLDILQITFGGLSLPFIYRHSGYGRQGAWQRPWNEDGVPSMAVFTGVVSLLIFGCNGLTELHPQHPYYSRSGVLLSALILLWFQWMHMWNAVSFAWHFLSFGKTGDCDAYWLGVWSACIVGTIFATITATFTYMILFGKALKREEEARVGEMTETDPLLERTVGTEEQARSPAGFEAS